MSSRYDEYGAYERPRRHTRPRTKERPEHANAVEGRVVTIDRGRYTLLVAGPDQAEPDGHQQAPADSGSPAPEPRTVVTAMKSRPLGRQGVVVGDLVRVVGDVSGAEGSLARIVDVLDRRTVLRRTADDDDPVERVIVANADQLVIVTALADPEPRPRLIDRCLVAAFDAQMTPLLVLTKADLGDPQSLRETYRPLGVDTLTTQRGADLGPIRARLEDQVSVLVGHSGVGKSTLVNALIPQAHRTTSSVNSVTGRGRHTSTSAVALALPSGGWIIDTPGIRSFGLAHVDPRSLIGSFNDLAQAATDCPRGCTHVASEPECALDDAVTRGEVDPARVTSFRRLLASREGGDQS